MTIRTLNGIKRIIEAYMATWEIIPSGDDGLHIAGYDRHGTWHEFTSVSQALQFANYEHYLDMQAKEGKK